MTFRLVSGRRRGAGDRGAARLALASRSTRVAEPSWPGLRHSAMGGAMRRSRLLAGGVAGALAIGASAAFVAVRVVDAGGSAVGGDRSSGVITEPHRAQDWESSFATQCPTGRGVGASAPLYGGDAPLGEPTAAQALARIEAVLMRRLSGPGADESLRVARRQVKVDGQRVGVLLLRADRLPSVPLTSTTLPTGPGRSANHGVVRHERASVSRRGLRPGRRGWW